MADDDENVNVMGLWALGTEDIRFFKGQQYAIASYALALLAGIIGVRSQFAAPADSVMAMRIGYVILVIAIPVAATVQIHSLQAAITRARCLADGAREYMVTSSKPIRDIVARQPKKEPWEADVHWLLTAAMVVGGTVAGLAMLFTVRA